ncbi:MAG: hypothetical protein GYB21_00970 [Oceanospirillales bacterium]|nr:hypothetical protein [Oceanospirillales bacterium]
MSKEHLTRYNEVFEQSEDGRLFVSPHGEVIDLTGMTILDTSIDTVRQLYQGKLSEELLDQYTDKLENEHSPIVQYHGHLWRLRRGGKSGFKFLLQNAEYGVVILVKNSHTSIERAGTHCKIELSPKLIRDQDAEATQYMMDELAAGFFIEPPMPCGVSVHIATDFQGWQPDQDFANSLTCKSQRVKDRNGFTTIEMIGGEVASVYGRGQSYTFGSVSSLQFALYNKSKEIIAHDKIDYFEGIWKAKVADDLTTKLWNPDLPVWRAELRFAQAVIRQFAEFNQLRLNTFEAVVKYLPNLWQYGLDRFRLDLNRRYIHPAWTILTQDAEWWPPSRNFIAKRQYKRPGIGNERNVALALGNLLSIYARNNLSSGQALRCLRKSGMWADLLAYSKARKISRVDLYNLITQGLQERRLTSKVAA